MQQQSTSQNQEIQKAFIQFLVQDAAAQGVQIQSEQDLQNYAQQLGEEGIQAKYQEFMQRMQGVKAKLGAKLQYLKKLKGIYPEDYYKTGGKVNDKKLINKKKSEYKKDMSNKDEATRDSLAINKWGDQDVATQKYKKGNYKKGIWTPDRSKYKK